eukprot:scaffold207202_cov36-Tisochrysis_lutea.AAC.1
MRYHINILLLSARIQCTWAHSIALALQLFGAVSGEATSHALCAPAALTTARRRGRANFKEPGGMPATFLIACNVRTLLMRRPLYIARGLILLSSHPHSLASARRLVE